MENLELYNSWREVPKNAQKIISGGNLNGKTDINPIWRIKVLTERFGPVGFGWYTKITEHWSDREVIPTMDKQTKQMVDVTEITAWVRVELYVKLSGEWSAPIEGIGGSKYAGKGRGTELNDEAFKMAETDAISVACKKLGIGADIYWAADNTKYTQAGTQGSAPGTQGAPSGTQYRAVTLEASDLNIRNQLVAWAAQGYNREQCEGACNQYYKATIPTEVWNKVMEAL